MKRYEEDFKVEAVKQVTVKNNKVADVAKRLGINQVTLRSWIKKSAPTESQSKENEAQKEIKRLKIALNRAEEERDILKKAAVFFANESA